MNVAQIHTRLTAFTLAALLSGAALAQDDKEVEGQTDEDRREIKTQLSGSPLNIVHLHDLLGENRRNAER